MFNIGKQPLLKNDHNSHFPLGSPYHMKAKDLNTASP